MKKITVIFLLFIFMIPFSAYAEEILLSPGEFEDVHLKDKHYVEVSVLSQKDGGCQIQLQCQEMDGDTTLHKGPMTEIVMCEGQELHYNSDHLRSKTALIKCTETGAVNVTITNNK